MNAPNVTAELILDAAERRFRTRGYHAVSFRELAGDIAVKSASVHYHFPAKADLAVALVDRYRKRFCDGLRERTRSASPREKLRAFVAAYRDALVADGAICLCGMFGAESGGLPDAVTRAVRRFFEANISWVGSVLEEGALSTSAEDDARLIVATLQGAMMLAASLGDFTVFDMAARKAVQPFLA